MFLEMWLRIKVWFFFRIGYLEENDEGKLRGLIRKLRFR